MFVGKWGPVSCVLVFWDTLEIPVNKVSLFCCGINVDLLYYFVVTQIDVPLFSGTDSFLVYTSLFDLALMFDFSFSFRPLSPDGVILYSSQFPTAPVGDYVLLQMYNGYVQFIFDCGSGRGVLTSSDPIELNTWHSVRAMRVGRVGQLNVNSQPPQTGSSLGVFARLNLAQNLYIG